MGFFFVLFFLIACTDDDLNRHCVDLDLNAFFISMDLALDVEVVNRNRQATALELMRLHSSTNLDALMMHSKHIVSKASVSQAPRNM